MFDFLKEQFKTRTIKKEYIALVHGHLPKQNGTINKPIGRSSSNARMAARVKAIDHKDRQAITEYEVSKRFQKYDFVTARPLTGRTHQIRVHFMSMGNPIVGDHLYRIHGQKKTDVLKRPFLHAKSITFTDQKGKEQTVESELPSELEVFLAGIKEGRE